MKKIDTEIIKDFFETTEIKSEVKIQGGKKNLIDSKFLDNFYTKRTEICDKIQYLSEKFKRIETLTEMQIELFSYRQILVEERSLLNDILIKIKELYNTHSKEAMLKIKIDYDLKIKNNQEFEIAFNSELNDIITKKTTFENQREFLTESLNTIDRMIFGVKFRLQTAEYLSQ